MEVPKTKRGGRRRKIEIKKVEDEKKRLVTFTKRRQGLFKKASDLSKVCGAKTALVVFSKNGKSYTCGDVDAVFDHYLTGTVPEIDDKLPLKEDKPVEEEKGFWWEKTIDETMLEWLMEYEARLKELKKNAEAKLEERSLKAQANASLSSSDDPDHHQDVSVNANDPVRGHDEVVDFDFGGFGLGGAGDDWFL